MSRGHLRLVADYGTAGVIITTADMGWLYAPYDGGADVIAAAETPGEVGRRYTLPEITELVRLGDERWMTFIDWVEAAAEHKGFLSASAING